MEKLPTQVLETFLMEELPALVLQTFPLPDPIFLQDKNKWIHRVEREHLIYKRGVRKSLQL